MPSWAVDVIVGVVVSVVPTTGAGVLRYLFKIEGSLATIVATVKANADAIDELQTWRLNVEHARALGQLYTPPRSHLRRDIS